MARLHWDVQGAERFASGGAIVEVAISGPDVVERAAETDFVRRSGWRYPLDDKTQVLLGHFDENGRWFGEWDLYLDIDPSWVWSQMPESVKQAAWGKSVSDNPRRPPKKWMSDCVAGVKESGSAADPGAVCGSLWYHKLSNTQRRAALQREKEGRDMEANPDAYKTWLMGVRRQLQRTGFGDATPVLRSRERELRGLYVSGASTSEGARFVGETFQRGDYAANPTTETTALLIGLGALVVVGGIIWYVNKSKEGTGTKAIETEPLPSPATCSFDEIRVHTFAMSKGLFGVYAPAKLSDWKPAFPPPWVDLYKKIPPLADKSTPAPLLVLSDGSFWTYDFDKDPPTPTKRDGLRDEYCKLFGSPASIQPPPAAVQQQSPASVFLPSGI